MKFFKGSFSRELYHGDDVGIFTSIIYFNLFNHCCTCSGTREGTCHLFNYLCIFLWCCLRGSFRIFLGFSR